MWLPPSLTAGVQPLPPTEWKQRRDSSSSCKLFSDCPSHTCRGMRICKCTHTHTYMCKHTCTRTHWIKCNKPQEELFGATLNNSSAVAGWLLLHVTKETCHLCIAYRGCTWIHSAVQCFKATNAVCYRRGLTFDKNPRPLTSLKQINVQPINTHPFKHKWTYKRNMGCILTEVRHLPLSLFTVQLCPEKNSKEVLEKNFWNFLVLGWGRDWRL